MATKLISETELVRLVRQLQVIICALVMGTLTFHVVAFVIRATDDGQTPDAGLPLLTLVAFLVAAVSVAMQFIVPNIVTTNVLRQSKSSAARSGTDQPSRSSDNIDRERLGQAFMAQTIIAGALLEGAAFMSLIAYLIQGNLLCVLLAVLLVMGIAVRFPTTSKVAAWIEAKHRRLEEERLLAN